MRSLLVLAAVLVVVGLVVIRHLPEGEAAGDTGQTAALAPRNQIQSIAIDGGAGRLPITALRGQLSSHVGDVLDEATLTSDRHALEQLLASRGYLAAKVAPAAVTYAPQGGAYIVFDVEPGPMFHFRTIDVTGPGKQEVGVVTISSGDEAISDRATHAKQALQDTFARRGHKVSVELAQRTDLAAAAVDVTITTR